MPKLFFALRSSVWGVFKKFMKMCVMIKLGVDFKFYLYQKKLIFSLHFPRTLWHVLVILTDPETKPFQSFLCVSFFQYGVAMPKIPQNVSAGKYNSAYFLASFLLISFHPAHTLHWNTCHSLCFATLADISQYPQIPLSDSFNSFGGQVSFVGLPPQLHLFSLCEANPSGMNLPHCWFFFLCLP